MKWHTEKRKISELKGWEINPRKISEEKFDELTYSIEQLGNFEPLVIDKDGTVLSGNQRLKVAQQMGETEVEVSVPEEKLTEAEKKKIGIIGNTHSGEFDFGMYGDEFADTLTEMGLDDLLPDEEVEIEEDDYEEPDDLEIVAQEGDVWQLGVHRLVCGDATEPEDVDKLMNGEKAQMCFTDPPYNMDYKGGGGSPKRRRGILNDKMSDEGYYQFLLDANEQIIRHTNGGVYICMGSGEMDTLKVAWEEAGGHWQDYIIWVKNNFTLSGADYQHTYESILYGWPEGITNHYFVAHRNRSNVWEDLRKVKTEYKNGFTTISFQGFKVKLKGKVTEGEVIRKAQKTDIWRYDKPSVSKEHPTMKPLALCSEAIRNSSKKGEIVMDIFGGSGSTLIAAEKIGRVCYTMELDPRYASVIIDRYQKLTGEQAQKLE